MNRNYKNGRALEYRAKKRLEERGWFVVRSAGSHSPVDLVAVKPDQRPLGVQCKLGSGFTSKERLALRDFCLDMGMTPVLCEKGLRFTFLNAEEVAA